MNRKEISEANIVRHKFRLNGLKASVEIIDNYLENVQLYDGEKGNICLSKNQVLDFILLVHRIDKYLGEQDLKKEDD